MFVYVSEMCIYQVASVPSRKRGRVRDFSDVSDDEAETLTTFQDPNSLVVRQTVERATVAFQDLVAQLEFEMF